MECPMCNGTGEYEEVPTATRLLIEEKSKEAQEMFQELVDAAREVEPFLGGFMGSASGYEACERARARLNEALAYFKYSHRKT